MFSSLIKLETDTGIMKLRNFDSLENYYGDSDKTGDEIIEVWPANRGRSYKEVILLQYVHSTSGFCLNVGSRSNIPIIKHFFLHY